MGAEATPIEVWLEWRQRPRAAVVMPYVRAHEQKRIDYRLVIKRQGKAGATHIQHSGDLVLQPHLAKALGELRVNRDPGDTCTVWVSVSERGEEKAVERSAECPPAR